jgi:RNA polymerase sigma-70 factor (ECF subfamily)
MTVSTEDVWEEFGDRLRSFINARVPPDVDADDLLSDVFVKVHTRIDALRDDQRLAPWLYQITRNTVIDAYRGRRINAALTDLDPPGDEDEHDAARVIAEDLRGMVAGLPDKYREALVLTEFEGLSQVEMADRLGLSVSGAKSRVQRARGMLRDQLLACCHFEFDRRGHVIDFTPTRACCTPV